MTLRYTPLAVSRTWSPAPASCVAGSRRATRLASIEPRGIRFRFGQGCSGRAGVLGHFGPGGAGKAAAGWPDRVDYHRRRYGWAGGCSNADPSSTGTAPHPRLARLPPATAGPHPQLSPTPREGRVLCPCGIKDIRNATRRSGARVHRWCPARRSQDLHLRIDAAAARPSGDGGKSSIWRSIRTDRLRA
jgi:hypothetical protein